jgi:hypothetical protein
MSFKLTLILLLFACCLSAYEIEADKGWHFTGCAGLFILSDCFCELTDAPGWIPYMLVIGVSVGKELTDDFFNWKDMLANGAGLSFGILVRL